MEKGLGDEAKPMNIFFWTSIATTLYSLAFANITISSDISMALCYTFLIV